MLTVALSAILVLLCQCMQSRARAVMRRGREGCTLCQGDLGNESRALERRRALKQHSRASLNSPLSDLSNERRARGRRRALKQYLRASLNSRLMKKLLKKWQVGCAPSSVRCSVSRSCQRAVPTASHSFARPHGRACARAKRAVPHEQPSLSFAGASPSEDFQDQARAPACGVHATA